MPRTTTRSGGVTLRLIDVPVSSSSPIDSHPLLRECFAEQVRTRFPEAWRAGHRRLFEHLCKTTEYRPATLAGLQPLYQAVAHGCIAGLHEQTLYEVYVSRILRGKGVGGFFSRNKFGAIGANLGAVANFFAVPWSACTPNLLPNEHAWLLIEAATNLRALGRLAEAVKPMRIGIETAAMLGNWKEAANGACNLSELELTRGEISGALTAADQSVSYADRGRCAPVQMITTLADALHQAGQSDESRRQFEDAEARQAALQPKYPQLYAQGGFRYCDLLLSDAERLAWQHCLIGLRANPVSESSGTPLGVLGETEHSVNSSIVAACASVSERATRILGWRRLPRWNRAADSLLDIALDHLILVRATLYKAHFVGSIPHTAVDHIAAAVDGLRAAGDMSYLPCGLLTRA